MGKRLKQKSLRAQRTTRSLLAVSLAATLAAAGCTTNQNLGNGTPARSGSELRSAPTSGVTSGRERTSPQPMTSSYTRAEVLPAVKPLSRADRAAAIMAGHQRLRGRYLGVVNPGPAGRPYVSDGRTGQLVNPALLTNPQLTINSSISSNPVPGLNTGVSSTGFSGGATGSATVATGTGFAAGASVTGDVITPTTTAAGANVLPPGAFAAARPTITEAASLNPTITAASVGEGRIGAVATDAAVGTQSANATAVTATSAPATSVTSASGSVRLVRPSGSRATITNVSSGTTSGTGRSQ